MKKRVLFYRAFLLLQLVSLFSVSACVGGNLVLDRYYAQVALPPVEDSSPESEGLPWDVRPDSCSFDADGLPLLCDTKDVSHILLIGADARNSGDPCRSDAMVLLSVNRKTKTVVLSSLLRDIYVPMEGHRDNRLNSAYAFGGAEYLCSVLRDSFYLDVKHYITVDFRAFSSVVDLLGGVDLNITAEEAAFVNTLLPSGASPLPLCSGRVHLNGASALAYVRNRNSALGDFDRTERQRRFLGEIVNRLKGMGISELLSLFGEILPYVTTNIPYAEFRAHFSLAPDYFNYSLRNVSIPAKGTFSFAKERGMSVIKVNFRENILFLYNEIYT